MADTNSIFYQIGLKVKGSVADATAELLSADNTWTDTNDFEGAVTVSYDVGSSGELAILDVKGTASTSDKLTAESLDSTGDADAKGNLTVSGSATISKDLTVEGNLTVSGTEAIVDADSLDVTDNILKLSDGASGGSYAKDSGLYFERGAGKPASAFVFDESEESFVVGTLEGSGTPTESLGTGVVSATFTTDASNQVTAIVYTGPSGALTYVAEGSSYSNTSVGLGGKKFTARYQRGTNYIDAVFLGGELLRLTHHGSTLVTYDFSTVIAPSGSNADIANTTPAPLTVGSLKLTNVVSGATCKFGKFAITIGGPIVAGRIGVSVAPTNTQGFNSSWPKTGEFYENTTGHLYYLPKSGDTYNDMVAAAGRFTPHPQGTHWDDATITVTLIGNVGGESPYTDYTATSGTALSFTANQIVHQELGDLVDFDAGYDA